MEAVLIQDGRLMFPGVRVEAIFRRSLMTYVVAELETNVILAYEFIFCFYFGYTVFARFQY
jgi:hypothetical protein